jgi:arabinan endo-1,5-alpha-L-arabinosidase
MQHQQKTAPARWRCGLIGLLSLFCAAVQAVTITGVPNSHDPAGLIKDGDTYFHFTTGQGIWYSTSTNLTHWSATASPVFPSGWPSWINNAVPGFAGAFWAPDVIQMKGYYYLYYSASTFGSSRSAIGVVRTVSLKNPSWVDLGMVVSSSGASTDMNAIDPALFRDHDGRVYMSYGSFFGGLGLVEINPSTGKTTGNVQQIYGGNHQSIEAPYISRQGNYYYLYLNRGACCQGSNSSYYIQVARATSVWGPYQEERSLLPNQSGNYKGPGHVGVLKDSGCQYVSTHYYDLNDGGNAKLDLLKMSFSSGWPSLSRNFSVASCGGVSEGTYRIKARHSGKYLSLDNASTANGALVEQYTLSTALHQQWQLISLGDGSYSLINSHSGQALDVWELSTSAGASIAQWPYWGGAGQKWVLEDAGSGYFRIRSVLSNHVLDVSGASTANDAKVLQWTVTGGTNQQWLLERL